MLRRYPLVVAIMALSLALAVRSPSFLTPGNLLDMLWSVSIIGLVGSGVTFVVLTAGIDLSAGPMLVLLGILCGEMLTGGFTGGHPVPVVPALLGTLLAGAVLGAFNGVLVARGRIMPFVATLGTAAAFSGFQLLATQGQTISVLQPDVFVQLGIGKLVGVPIPVIIMVGTFTVCHVIARYSSLGRMIYAVGSSPEAARLSGLPVARIIIIAYAIAGLTAAVAGIILTAETQQAGNQFGNGGQDYTLDAITAVVIGGTSLFGGEGSVIGTFLGAVLIGIIENGLDLLNVSNFYHEVVKGLVILVAVGSDTLLRQRTARRGFAGSAKGKAT